MNCYAEGTLGYVAKKAGIPCENQHVACVAVLRDPSEMLNKN